jgi:hypothetical protein
VDTYGPIPQISIHRQDGQNVTLTDKSDTQNYLDSNNTPFLEPSLELSMVDAVENGAFDLILLPSRGSTLFSWQFIVLRQSTSELRFYNFSADENGLFDINGKRKNFSENYKILPDSSCFITRAGSDQPLSLQGPPRAVVYVKHEKVVQPDGTSIGVKRAARFLLTQTVLNDKTVATATFDSAVGVDGTMARLSGPISSSEIEPSVFDLFFNGVSYLQINPPASGDNPLAIKGPYSISFMICPAERGHNTTIFGGMDTCDPTIAAPFVRIVDGDKLQVGFGNGKRAVQYQTLHQVLFPGVWSTVKVEFKFDEAHPFAITINNSVAVVKEVKPDIAPTEREDLCTLRNPNGANRCAQKRIFRGAESSRNLGNQLKGSPKGSSHCKAAVQSDRLFRNPADYAQHCQVWRYRNRLWRQERAISSPVDINMSGTFHIDEIGLTYYSGIANFIQPQSPSCLLDGSDGLLHLYFKGSEGQFSVAQFSTASARATFSANWSTNWEAASVFQSENNFHPGRYLSWPTEQWHRISDSVLVASDKTQSGFLNFVAHRVGTYMNKAEIKIASSAISPLLCDVTVTVPSEVGIEIWKSLPRAVDQMSMIWNGAGSNSPDAQEVQNRRQPYFDYKGLSPAVFCPVADQSSGSYFIFTSVAASSAIFSSEQPSHVPPLAAVTITSGTSKEFVTIELESAMPSNWQPGDTLKQSWANVPADAKSILDLFAGRATPDRYKGFTASGTRAYGLRVTTSRSDEPASHVVLFVKDELKDVLIDIIDGANSSTSNRRSKSRSRVSRRILTSLTSIAMAFSIR